MRILLVSRQYGLGGTERRLTDLNTYFLEQSHESRIHYTILNSNKFNNLLIIRIARLFLHIFIFRPTIVHAFDLETGIYIFLVRKLYPGHFLLISGLGAEKVYVPRTLELLKKQKYLPDLYINNNTKASKELAELTSEIRPVYTIHNGLNTNRLKNAHPMESEVEQISKHKITIGYIGKFDEIKHGERFIELCVQLVERYDYPFQFIAIGDGPNRGKIDEMISRLSPGLQSKFWIRKQVQDAGILARYFTIGILCSDSEGLPNVLLEYMYHGVPWISTNVGEVRKINKVPAGVIIDSWDIDQFEKEIHQLIENPEKYKQLAENGRRLFRDKYSIEVMGDRVLEVYQQNL